MGYDAYSHVVYGVTVNKKDLETVENIRGCNHSIDENNKFCPECGSPVWKQRTISLLDDIKEEAKGKLSYFTESGDAYNDPNYNFIIGFQLATTEYNKNRVVVSQPTEQMRKEILDFIKKNKLKLTEDDIKTFVYTYHSY